MVLGRGYDRFVDGRRVAVVEDILNTGVSVRRALDAVRAAGVKALIQSQEKLAENYGAALEEIRSGAFAKEWSSDRQGKLDLIRQIRQVQAGLPITGWDEATRRAFRIGDAGKSDPVSDDS